MLLKVNEHEYVDTVRVSSIRVGSGQGEGRTHACTIYISEKDSGDITVVELPTPEEADARALEIMNLVNAMRLIVYRRMNGIVDPPPIIPTAPGGSA